MLARNIAYRFNLFIRQYQSKLNDRKIEEIKKICDLPLDVKKLVVYAATKNHHEGREISIAKYKIII